MVVTRLSGGPGRAPFKAEWQGATVLQQWQEQISDGMDDLAKEILDDLRVTIHEQSGDMRKEAFAEVSVSGTKRTIKAGSAVDYAIFEEIRHPQIRAVIDRHAPRLTEKIRAARQGGR